MVLCRPCFSGIPQNSAGAIIHRLQEDIRKNTTSGLVKREIIYREIPLIDFLSRMINICDIICMFLGIFIYLGHDVCMSLAFVCNHQ